jgi:hypothetical protein
VGLQQSLDPLPHFGIAPACLVQVGGALRRRGQLKGIAKDVINLSFGWVHAFASRCRFV